ncbi:MAG: hypothetical protein DCC58_13390 [Chloroflexi bacterium]|nr:MAG: hypothetical protein DCC58_13390 [Chloroflexota bacterium]
MGDSPDRFGAGAAHHADHTVPLRQEQLSKVGAILTCDSCDQRCSLPWSRHRHPSFIATWSANRPSGDDSLLHSLTPNSGTRRSSVQGSASSDFDSIPEVALSRIWQEGWLAPELRTTSGERVSVIYRGVWTHAHGPDFRDALVDIGGRIVSGAVELHRRSSDWRKHGHDADPAYDAVALHLVLCDDAHPPLRHRDGRPIPTVELVGFLSAPLDDLVARTGFVELGAIGHGACLPTLAGERELDVRAALREKGWERLFAKQLRFQQELSAFPPAEVLYRGFLDMLGLSANRQGMARLSELLPVTTVERTAADGGSKAVTALLLGCAGFLPLSPGEQALAGLTPAESAEVDQRWDVLRQHWRLRPLPSYSWTLDRVRPANHPVRRLAGFAGLVSGCAPDGLLARFSELLGEAPAAWETWLSSANPPFGSARKRQIQTNLFAPFAYAYAEVQGQHGLVDWVAALWEQLPGAVDDSVAKRTLRQIVGERRFPIRRALDEQGLHQIHHQGCAQLRCFECPIAELAMRYEQPVLYHVDEGIRQLQEEIGHEASHRLREG